MDKRPDVYFEGDHLIIRASSFGRCIGSLTRCGAGLTPEATPQSMLDRWAQGVVGEPQILAMVSRKGWKLLGPADKDMQQWQWGEDNQPQLELRVGKVVIRCHPDGIGQCYIGRAETGGAWTDHGDLIYIPEFNKTGDRRVVEAKLLRPSMDHHTFAPYKWQMSIEMAASGLPGLWAIGQKDDNGKLVEGPEGVQLEAVDVPDYSLLDIKRRALLIYRAVREGEFLECDARDFPCGYWTDGDTACSKVKAEVGEALPDELVEVARKWAKRKQTYEDAKKDLEEARNEILGGMKGRAGERFYGGGVRLVKKKGGQRFDRAAAEKEVGDLARFYENKSDYWELRAGDTA